MRNRINCPYCKNEFTEHGFKEHMKECHFWGDQEIMDYVVSDLFALPGENSE